MSFTAGTVDLGSCAAEPIRIPGAIQPHGALLVIDPVDLRVLHRSANSRRFLGVDIGLGEILDSIPQASELCAQIRSWISGNERALLCLTLVGGRQLQLNGHRSEQGVFLEFELPPQPGEGTLDGLYPRLRDFLDRISAANGLQKISEETVKEVRAITGFERILLYSFDEKGDGTVLAEDGDGCLPSYLGLRFPASDIPAQARELYRLNRIRLIANASYDPVPIEPPLSSIDGAPLDMSRASLRSVSPVHLEYMRNMNTASSMSMSIIVDGALWGLISGHSRAPKLINAQVRAASDILTQIVSLQIGSRLQGENAAERLELKSLETQLLSNLAVAPSFQRGLVENPGLWMSLTGATGAAVIVQNTVLTVGATPSERRIRDLAKWLFDESRGELVTDSLSSIWSGGEEIADVGSGLVAVAISQIRPDYILWFRPEVVRTVQWGGDPTKSVQPGEDRLHPRKSFDLWKEQVRLTARPWSGAEIESAIGFRASIQALVLRLAEEKAELTDRLEAANKELESFSYSISHDLRAPFRHIAGFAELLTDKEKDLDEQSLHYIETIQQAALAAGRLVDDLLHFSQLGRSHLEARPVNIEKLIDEVRRSLQTDIADRNIVWKIGSLPRAIGDASMLRQVFQNLIGNAIKYTRPRNPAIITIEGADDGTTTTYTVTDNGVGFEMAYVGKLFGVFQRLHRTEDFEGTGIGLALTKRIIERHGGRVSAEGLIDVGAKFTIALPRNADINRRSK